MILSLYILLIIFAFLSLLLGIFNPQLTQKKGITLIMITISFILFGVLALQSFEIEQQFCDSGTTTLQGNGTIELPFNVNVTGNVSIDGVLTDVKYIDFNTTIDSPLHNEGRFFYDKEFDTMTIYNDQAVVALQVGREMWIRVKNREGVTINDMQAVYFSGSTGIGIPEVKLARADNITTGRVVGLATQDITDNGVGEVTTFGLVNGVDTSMWSANDTLFLSPTQFGNLTNAIPQAPHFPIQIGIVLASHPTEGKIFVNVGPTDVTNGMVINELWVNTNFNVTGNITGNYHYAEAFFHSDTPLLVIPISDSVTYFNMTNLSLGPTNGWSLDSDNITLTTQVSGTYKVDWSLSFAGAAGNIEYQATIKINENPQNTCEAHRKIGTANDQGNFGGACILSVNTTDTVRFGIKNTGSTANAIVSTFAMNFLRVGD